MSWRRLPNKASIAAVREAIDVADETGMSYHELLQRAGISHQTMVQWKRGRAPRLFEFDCFLKAIGYRLAIEKIDARP